MPCRLMLLLLCAPALALAQTPPPLRIRVDTPLLYVQPGAHVRALSARGMHEGTLLGVDLYGMSLRLSDAQQVRLPFSALSLVEEDRGGPARLRGAVIGGLSVGAVAALFGALVCGFHNGLGEADDAVSVSGCALAFAAFGSSLGALGGLVLASRNGEWKPVWVRPPSPAAPPRVLPPASPPPVPIPALERLPPAPAYRPAGPLPEP